MIPTHLLQSHDNKTPTYNYSTAVPSTTIATVESKQHIPILVTVILEIIILIVALIGNTIVVLIVVKKRRMQTFTNWLILNLAIADLFTVLICIPLEIPIELNPEYWPYAKEFCRIFYPIQTASIYGSVFTLVGLGLSRYWAVVHPFRKQPTVKMAKLLISIIWASSIVVVIPYILILDYHPETRHCQESWTDIERRKYTIALFVFQYVLPLVIISVAYIYIIYDLCYRKQISKVPKDNAQRLETKKVVKLLLVVTVTFAACILPYHVVALTHEFGNASEFKYIEDVSIMSYIILYLNAALNPILYNVFSSKFREAFTEFYKTLKSYAAGSKGDLEGAGGFFSSRRPSVFESRRWSKHNSSLNENSNVHRIKEKLLAPQYLSADACTKYSAVQSHEKCIEEFAKKQNGFIKKNQPVEYL